MLHSRLRLLHAWQEEQQSLVQQLKQQCSGMAAVLPFASTTIVKASSSTQAEIYFGLAKAVDVSGTAAAGGPQLSMLLGAFIRQLPLL
jgi:hypothetical protein